MADTRLSILEVTVALERFGVLQHVTVAASFDKIASSEAARTVGRQIGEALSDNLERRLRHGEDLGSIAA